jgi:hypothetical protein
VDARGAAHGTGLDVAAAAARLALAEGGVAYYVAAVRKCFDEAGLLFMAVPPPSGTAERPHDWCVRLQRGEAALADPCAAEGATLALDELVYLSHWVMPLGRGKRFDSCFFVARATRKG